jgi:hypothetical protein
MSFTMRGPSQSSRYTLAPMPSPIASTVTGHSRVSTNLTHLQH